MSKPVNEWMGLEMLGHLDSTLFVTYSLSQFLTGYIGDQFDKKKILMTSYLVQAVGFAAIGLA